MVLQCISTYVQSTGSYVYTYIQNNNTLHIATCHSPHACADSCITRVFTYSLYLRVCHYAQHSALKCAAFHLWSYPINIYIKHPAVKASVQGLFLFGAVAKLQLQ